MKGTFDVNTASLNSSRIYNIITFRFNKILSSSDIKTSLVKIDLSLGKTALESIPERCSVYGVRKRWICVFNRWIRTLVRMFNYKSGHASSISIRAAVALMQFSSPSSFMLS